MKITSLLLIAIIIGGFATGLLSFHAAVLVSGGKTPQNLNEINDTSNVVSSLQGMYNITEAAQNISVSTTGTDVGNQNLISAAFSGMMRAFQLPNFFQTLIKGLTAQYIPTWVFDMLVAAAMLMVIAALYYFFRGVEA